MAAKDPPPTAAARAAERSRILAAGYHVLARSGGAAVPITEILAAAGLGTRAFYRHFDSKDALLLAMFRRDSDRALDELRSAAAAEDTGAAALAVWVRGMTGMGLEPRRRARAMVLASEEVTRAKGYREERERYHVEQDRSLADILRRGRDDGSLSRARPEQDAPFVRAALHQANYGLFAEPSPTAAAQATGALLDFLRRALS